MIHVVSLGTNNHAKVFKERGELLRDEFAYYVYLLSGSLPTILLSGYSSFHICFHIEPWLFHLYGLWTGEIVQGSFRYLDSALQRIPLFHTSTF